MSSTHPLVLVVTDYPDMRDLLAFCLEQWACRTVGAANGREALRLLETGRPFSLIVLDLLMPEMDGFAFRAAQLRRPAFATIPVVVVSSLVPLGSRDREALGAAEYLKTPVDMGCLESAVRRLTANATVDRRSFGSELL